MPLRLVKSGKRINERTNKTHNLRADTITIKGHHGDEIEVSGPIAANQVVAVEGAYELQDGMAVKVAAP